MAAKVQEWVNTPIYKLVFTVYSLLYLLDINLHAIQHIYITIIQLCIYTIRR